MREQNSHFLSLFFPALLLLKLHRVRTLNLLVLEVVHPIDKLFKLLAPNRLCLELCIKILSLNHLVHVQNMCMCESEKKRQLKLLRSLTYIFLKGCLQLRLDSGDLSLQRLYLFLGLG
jgi:hypothetical protein